MSLTSQLDEAGEPVRLTSPQPPSAGPVAERLADMADKAPGRTVVTEDLGAKVLFPEARRLRRRRWATGSVLVAVALVAGGVAYAAVTHASAKAPVPKTVGSISSTAAVAAHASLFFRPVDCMIAPLSATSPAEAARDDIGRYK